MSRERAGGTPMRRLVGRLKRVGPWQWALVAVVAAYIGYFTYESVRMHYGLATFTYDFALYDQGAWLLSRFKAPFITLMGRNLFGDHTSFIMILLVPLYWIVPHPVTLLVAQSVAMGLAAVPVYLLARRRLGSEPLALVFATALLLHPALGRTNVENFHPDAFLPVLVGFAIYFAVVGRWRPYWVFVALALLVKEDVGLVILPLGLWVAVRRDRRVGLATMGVAVAYTAFAMGVVMLLLNGEWAPNAWRIPFGGMRGMLATIVTEPREFVSYLLSENRPWYLLQVGAPFAFLFLGTPFLASVSLLVIASNVISVFGYQHNIRYHYTAVILPALAMATVEGVRRLRGRWRVSAAAVVLSMSALGAFWWGTFGFSLDPRAYWSPYDPAPTDARAIVRLVPDDAVVSAYHLLTPHLAHREHIYMFPNPFSTVLYGDADTRGQDGRELPIASEVEYVVLPTDFGIREMGSRVWATKVRLEFELVSENAHWGLWRRR